jgi:hypothetical protein
VLGWNLLIIRQESLMIKVIKVKVKKQKLRFESSISLAENTS